MIKKRFRFFGHVRGSEWISTNGSNVVRLPMDDLNHIENRGKVRFCMVTKDRQLDDILKAVGKRARVEVIIDVPENEQDAEDLRYWVEECADEISLPPEPKVIGLMGEV